MRLSRLSFVIALSLAPAAPAFAGDAKATASASVTVSIKADVNAKAQAQAAAGDAAYAAGKFDAALAAYGEGFAMTRDTAFIYAMAQCHKAMGHKAEAESMFKMYLSASGSASLKYKSEAEGAIGAGATSAIGAVGGALKGAKDATASAVTKVGSGVYDAAKVSVAASVDAKAKVSAEAGDKAYASAKYADAARSYAEAYAQSQQAVALYAYAQASAPAGNAANARGALTGYLVAQPKGPQASDARTLLLAVGGNASLATKVAVSGKVSADAKAQAAIGDKAIAAGKFADAAKAYGEAYAKKSDAALLYAKGMASFYAGQAADAQASLKAYLAASGKLEFKVSAEATLRASGGGV